MDNEPEPTNQETDIERGTRLKILTDLDISNTPEAAKRRRKVHGVRAATLLHLAETLTPPSQQWLFFLVLVHTLDDFDNPMYVMCFLHAITIWWFPGTLMVPSYLSLAGMDKYWQTDRPKDELKISIRHLLISTGLWFLNPGLDLLCRQYVNIEAWNWALLPVIPGMLLPVVPGSLLMFEHIVAINAFVPEGERGVLIAVLFRGCQMLLPEYLHWLLYLCISSPQVALDWRFAEWVYCSLWWWYFAIPIDVAYGIGLMNSQLIHANTTLRAWGGAPSIILQRERLGTVWFAATCLVLRAAQWSLGFQFRLEFEFQNPSWHIVLFWLILFGSATFFLVVRARNDQRYKSTKFHYRQLEPEHGRNAIRLLRLHPKSPFGDGPIVCDLLHTSLEFAPVYTAISYTWGAPASYEVIQIDGLEFKVSPNVYSILRGKRSTNYNVILWVDSICINQEDGDEKSTQVGLMRQIFEEASSTIAWIGDVDPAEAKLAIDLLRKFDAVKAAANFEKGLSSQERREWNAFWELMSSPWFERSWIVQEIVVATQPVLRYGSEEIPWETFARAITSISLCGMKNLFLFEYRFQSSGQLETGSGLENAIIMENLRLASMNGDYLALKDMLKVGLMFKATLPIDKVYALLGIVLEGGMIHPDHSRTGAKKTESEIVLEALKDMMKTAEKPKEVFGFISGNTQQTTRRVGNIMLRSPNVTIKNAVRWANDAYAWLEKISPEGKENSFLHLAPDYTGGHTAEGAYTMVAQELVRKKDTFSFLHHAGIGQPRKLKGLPSWVPDWSVNPAVVSLPQCNYKPPRIGVRFAHENGKMYPLGSSGKGKDKPATKEEWVAEGKKNSAEWIARRQNAVPEIAEEHLEEDGKILRIKGILLDTISELLDLSYSADDLPTDVEGKARAIYKARFEKYGEAQEKVHTYARSPYGDEDAIHDAFWRTVIADSNIDGTQPASQERIEKQIRWLKGIEPMFLISHATAALDSGIELTPEIRKKITEIHKAYLFHSQIQESAEVKFAHLLRNEIAPSFKMYRWETPANMLKKGQVPGMEPKYIFDEKEEFGMGFFQDCVDFTAARSLAISGEGWLGLVPDGASKGDRVVVVKVKGGRKCFVLRGVEGEEVEMVGDERWDLVGEGFFYGLTTVDGFSKVEGDVDDSSKDNLSGEKGLEGEERSFRLR